MPLCASRTLGSAILLAVAISSVGCQSEQERLDAHLARSEEYSDDGKLQEALLELRSALQLEPNDSEINFRIASIALAMERTHDAIFYFREARRLDPTRSDAAIGEAALILWTETEDAEKLVRETIEREPDFAPAYGVLADLELKRLEIDAAMAAARTAVELEPDSGRWHQRLGIVYAAKVRAARAAGKEPTDEDYQQAIAQFERASELFVPVAPGMGWRPLFQRARLLADWEGHEDEVMPALERAVETAAGDPDTNRQALAQISAWAEEAGKSEISQWALSATTELDDAPLISWMRLATVTGSAGGDAAAVYERLRDARPDDAQAQVVYARFRAATDPEAALSHLRALVDQGVEPPVLLSGMFEILVRLDRMEEASAILEELEADYADAPETRLVLARKAIGDRDYERAIELLGALADAESSAIAQRLLAEAHLKQGSHEEALRAIARAIEASEPTPLLLLQQAKIQQTVGDHRSAWASLRAIQRQRTLTEGERYMAAVTLYQLGKPQAARLILEQMLKAEEPPIGAALLYSNREAARDPEAARTMLLGFEKRFPNNPSLAYELARIDQIQGRDADALARLNDFVGRSGQASPEILIARAQLLAGQGQFALAQQDALQTFELDPNRPGVLSLLVALYEREGDLEGAVASFEEADQAGVLRPAGRMLLARLYMRLDRSADAERVLEEVVATADHLPTAKNDLAYLLVAREADLDRALELAHGAQQQLPDNASVADTVGYVYLKKGLHDPALQQFEYAIELSRGSGEQQRPQLEYHRALALRALERDAEAVAALEAALALDPEFPEAGHARSELEAARSAVAGGNSPKSSS